MQDGTAGYLPEYEKIIYPDWNHQLLTHEIFHAMANRNGGNDWGNFGRYLGEGITQYLMQEATGIRDPRAYPFETETVHLLHNMYGDRILEAYLCGEGYKMFEDMAIEVCGGDKESEKFKTMSKNIEIMKNGFLAHDIYQTGKGDSIPENTLWYGKDADECLKLAKKAMLDNYRFYELDKIEKSGYIMDDGRVDFESFLKGPLLVYLQSHFYHGVNSSLTNLGSQLIKSSDLLKGLSEDQQEEYKKQILSDISSAFQDEIQIFETGYTGNIGNAYNDVKEARKKVNFNQDREPYTTLYSHKSTQELGQETLPEQQDTGEKDRVEKEMEKREREIMDSKDNTQSL